MIRSARTSSLLFLLSTVWCAVPARVAAQCLDADLLLRHAKIVTMDDAGHVAEALAVRDGKILDVGTEAELAGCVSPRTKVLDLEGRTVLPGLIDVHAHAIEWAKSELQSEVEISYQSVHSIAEIAERVKRSAGTRKAGEWIRGAGWDQDKLAEQRYITRGDLDRVAPDNPVYLGHRTGHLAAVNSVALRLAKITGATADPPGGVIEHDAGGEPTGILKDNAMELVSKLFPADPADLSVEAAKYVSEHALEAGLTTIHNISVQPEEMRAYQEARRRGWLKVRVQMVPLVSKLADAERLAASGLYTGFGDDQLKLGAVKMFADGGMGARTIAIYPPELKGEKNPLGLLVWKTEEMQKAHLLLAWAGWQLVTHAIGDRAIDQVLDSYARVKKELGLKDARFRIAHCGIATPTIQKRMREIGVIADGNPAFIYWIGSYFATYGAERTRWAYPAKSYIENGVVEAAGSDVDVTPLRPWWGIWAAVVRREAQTDKVLAPEERLTVREALRLYTRNAAYDGFEEKQKGSLEAGKLADFIVVDRDVLTAPAEELKDVSVLKTFVGGELVYEKSGSR
jgi:predicted amidohydrolase YtcJ